MESPQPAIEVREISKIFKLYKKQKDHLLDFIFPFGQSRFKPYTALEPITLDIPKGEIFGIIGKNGSGKSTLFKILASVMSPTSGSYTIHGKLTALLELSAGFNRDLSGIDNLYYLGAIQGIRREEMAEKMEDIIQFAELGEYIHQPVRTYSSGMQSRLAFSMAVHVDPEILISDEVLSVGDVRFQQKCYRRVHEMKEMGKTILLCTHNLGAVREFCHRALWLHEGKLMALDGAREVCDTYEQFMLLKSSHLVVQKSKELLALDDTIAPAQQIQQPGYLWTHYESNPPSPVRFTMGCMTYKSVSTAKISGGEWIRITFGIYSESAEANVVLKITINGHFGIPLLVVTNEEFGKSLSLQEDKTVLMHTEFRMPFLTNGNYTISAELLDKSNNDPVLLAIVQDGLAFLVQEPEKRNNQKAQLRALSANFHTEFLQNP